MKAILTYLFLTISLSIVMAQAPVAFSYQGIANDRLGQPIVNKMLGIEIAIIKEDSNNPREYVERHEVVSSETGHFSLEVGRGTYVSGSSLSTIAILPDKYSLSVSIDTSGGTDYEFLGSSELLSVPYALHALSALNKQGLPGPIGLAGPPGPQGEPGIRPTDACCGPVSRKGEKGDPGLAGPDGEQGEAGLSGLETLRITDTPPDDPANGQIYLDNGSNRGDGNPGFRYYDETKWVDL